MILYGKTAPAGLFFLFIAAVISIFASLINETRFEKTMYEPLKE